jgi:hypothetical protein
VATFTDANPSAILGDFSATIDWGDGTPITSGAISGSPGSPFIVTGSHAYTSLGTKTITVHIVDDGGASATAIDSFAPIGTFPSGGAFVIGGGTTVVGTSVNFWGSMWATNNPLSGGSAPDAFKGYENGLATPVCGATWTSRPGNSSNPPRITPSDMAVIVSTHIVQDGSRITGDVAHIVIVHVDPGYSSDPGHAATATIVGVLC